MSSIYSQIASRIVEGQEVIIGPVAVEQAQRIKGIKLDWDHRIVEITGNETEAINALIEAYKQLFGQISVEVSKDAAASLIGQLPNDKWPEALK